MWHAKSMFHKKFKGSFLFRFQKYKISFFSIFVLIISAISKGTRERYGTNVSPCERSSMKLKNFSINMRGHDMT